MKKLLLILLSLGIIGSANAVSSVDDYFTSLCISESSTGFNWEKNAWKAVNFKAGTKHLITKVNPNEARNYECTDTKNLEDDSYFTNSNNEPKLVREGCYVIKEFGLDTLEYKKDCLEVWSTFPRGSDDINPKTKKLESVQCWDDGFYFSPNGLFQTSYVHGDVSNYSNYKDSLTVSVGKCSTL